MDVFCAHQGAERSTFTESIIEHVRRLGRISRTVCRQCVYVVNSRVNGWSFFPESMGRYSNSDMRANLHCRSGNPITSQRSSLLSYLVMRTSIEAYKTLQNISAVCCFVGKGSRVLMNTPLLPPCRCVCAVSSRQIPSPRLRPVVGTECTCCRLCT